GKVWCDSLFMSILLIDACSVQVRGEFFALGGQQRPAQLIGLRQPSLSLVAVAGRRVDEPCVQEQAAVTSAFTDGTRDLRDGFSNAAARSERPGVGVKREDVVPRAQLVLRERDGSGDVRAPCCEVQRKRSRIGLASTCDQVFFDVVRFGAQPAESKGIGQHPLVFGKWIQSSSFAEDGNGI